MGDEAVETLRLIWGEMKTLNAKIDRTREELSERLDRTREELSGRLERLERNVITTNEQLASLEVRTGEMRDRIVESEMRLATEVVALAGVTKEIRDGILAAGQARFALIEERLARLEKKAG